MKNKSAFLGICLLALTMISGSAMARTFYKSKFLLTVNYKNIDDDSRNIVEDYPVVVKYSDDHDFCSIYVGDQVYACLTYHPDNEPTTAQITINRDQAKLFIAEAMFLNECHENIHASFDRLGIYLDDTINLEFQGSDFFQQIHDEEPESFHIWMFDMSEGQAY